MIGLLTVDTHTWYRANGITITVLVDDVDVTAKCVAADDRHGWAVLYRMNGAGRRFIEGGCVAIEMIVGARVEFTWPQKDGAPRG